MRTSHLIAAAFLAVAGTSSFAAGPAKDYISPARLGESVRTREAVVAETRNAIVAGELKPVGDVVQSTYSAAVPESKPLTRAEVRAAVAAARADHTLKTIGEL